MGHMSYRHFASYHIIGGFVWVILFTYAGYFFGGLGIVQENLKWLILIIIVVSILPAIIGVRRAKHKAGKEAKRGRFPAQHPFREKTAHKKNGFRLSRCPTPNGM